MQQLMFQDDQQFWFETLRNLGLAVYEGSDVGEVVATASQVTSGDYDGWHDAWLSTAKCLEAEARASHPVSACCGLPPTTGRQSSSCTRRRRRTGTRLPRPDLRRPRAARGHPPERAGISTGLGERGRPRPGLPHPAPGRRPRPRRASSAPCSCRPRTRSPASRPLRGPDTLTARGEAGPEFEVNRSGRKARVGRPPSPRWRLVRVRGSGSRRWRLCSGSGT